MSTEVAAAATVGIAFAGIVLTSVALSAWRLPDRIRSRRKGGAA